jgi:signal transduction histidine kinase
MELIPWRGKRMESTKALFGYDSLAFFGRVNASISHELKNVMAIISETAGLLDDLSDMVSTGSHIPTETLKSCTASIMEEIQRGFSVIRQMNRFAHSVDTPSENVNLMDVLNLVIGLCGYLSFSGKTDLRPCEDITPVALTCPFLLQAIVYHALIHTFKSAGPDAEIAISIQARDDSAWRITFSGFTIGEFQVFPDPATKTMAASIGVVIRYDNTADRLEMDVPLRIDHGPAQESVPPAIADMDKASRNRA